METHVIDFGGFLFDGPSCLVESLERFLIVEVLMFH
jgi:hypothetical protein